MVPYVQVWTNHWSFRLLGHLFLITNSKSLENYWKLLSVCRNNWENALQKHQSLACCCATAETPQVFPALPQPNAGTVWTRKADSSGPLPGRQLGPGGQAAGTLTQWSLEPGRKGMSRTLNWRRRIQEVHQALLSLCLWQELNRYSPGQRGSIPVQRLWQTTSLNIQAVLIGKNCFHVSVKKFYNTLHFFLQKLMLWFRVSNNSFHATEIDLNLKDENLLSSPNTWKFQVDSFLKGSPSHIQSLTSHSKAHPPTAINQDKHMPNTNFILESSAPPETTSMKAGNLSSIQTNAF